MDNTKKMWHLYGFATVTSLALILMVAWKGGLGDALTVIVLAGLEMTFSFENAVINARILQGLNRFWQQMFITVGVIIAVFAVRMLLPIVLVAVTSSLSLGEVIKLALYSPGSYASHLKSAQPVIAAFGSTFLFMV